MKKLTQIALIVITAATTKIAHAVNYHSSTEDLLLVIRNGAKDMVWDVGTVSNYLGLASGTVVTVTNYIPASVITNFTSYNAANLGFTLVAASSDFDPSLRIWVTVADANPPVVPAQLTGNEWSTIQGKTKSFGQSASSFSTPVNSVNTAYVTAANNANSYSSKVSSSVATVPNWDGNFPYDVQSATGTSQKFYEIYTDAPAKLLGTFSMSSTTGAITFTAGNAVVVTLVPATITAVTRTGGTANVSFTTTNGNNYQLLYSTDLTTWQTNAAAGIVAGDNTIKTLHDSTADLKRFYRIQSF